MTNPLTTSATRLRLSLFVSMSLAIVAIVALVVYGVKYLDSYAAEVNEIVYESSTSNDRLVDVRRQVDELEKNTTAAERAKQIVAESQSYRYQDVIVRDLHSFANKAGIKITNFDFTAGNEASQSSGSPAPAATPDPDSPAAPTTPAQPTSQLRSTKVNITLDNPTNYRQLLQFIHYIEQNLTKMQIASITLSGSPDNESEIVSESLTIEVYIR